MWRWGESNPRVISNELSVYVLSVFVFSPAREKTCSYIVSNTQTSKNAFARISLLPCKRSITSESIKVTP